MKILLSLLQKLYSETIDKFLIEDKIYNTMKKSGVAEEA